MVVPAAATGHGRTIDKGGSKAPKAVVVDVALKVAETSMTPPVSNLVLLKSTEKLADYRKITPTLPLLTTATSTNRRIWITKQEQMRRQQKQ